MARDAAATDAGKRLFLCTTIVVVGALTLVALFPTSEWFDRVTIQLSESPGVAASAGESLHRGETTLTSTIGEETSSDDQVGAAAVLVDLNSFASRLKQFSSGRQQSLPRPFAQCCLAVVSLLTIVGVVRLLVAIWYAWSVCRWSVPIEDQTVHRMLIDLVAEVCPGRSVRIQQTSQLSSAAVSGWRQPSILLPSDWQQWTSAEATKCFWLTNWLTSHGVTFSGGTLSCVVTTTHYYNPLVHMLVRHTALTQEMAADALAGRVVGQRRYLRTLTSLALRHDNDTTYFSRVGLQPVFSGYLIRRIKMLKSQQNRHYFKEGVMARLSGAALVIVIGTLAFAAGGVTQSLGREEVLADKEDVRVARSESRKPDSEADPSQGMFQRQVTDPGVMPENDSGMIKVRIADIFQRPDALPLELIINRYSAQALKRLLESPELPDIDVSSISTLLGATQLETRHHPNTDRPQKNSLQLGVSDLVVRFTQPTNVAKWMEDFAPTVDATQEKGRAIYKLPPMHAIGPLPISFVVVDEQDDRLQYQDG